MRHLTWESISLLLKCRRESQYTLVCCTCTVVRRLMPVKRFKKTFHSLRMRELKVWIAERPLLPRASSTYTERYVY